MKNSELSSQESLKDEVAYVLTTATLLKQVHSAIKADKEKRWQPRLHDTNKQIMHQVRNVKELPLSENAKMLFAQRPRKIALATVIQKD
jgi:hypothetical protein